jgi:hypothetical protein
VGEAKRSPELPGSRHYIASPKLGDEDNDVQVWVKALIDQTWAQERVTIGCLKIPGAIAEAFISKHVEPPLSALYKIEEGKPWKDDDVLMAVQEAAVRMITCPIPLFKVDRILLTGHGAHIIPIDTDARESLVEALGTLVTPYDDDRYLVYDDWT